MSWARGKSIDLRDERDDADLILPTELPPPLVESGLGEVSLEGYDVARRIDCRVNVGELVQPVADDDEVDLLLMDNIEVLNDSPTFSVSRSSQLFSFFRPFR